MGVSHNRFCPQCGIQLASNAQFCMNCRSSFSFPSSLASSPYGGSPASVPYREGSSYPYGSSGQSYAPPPPLVGVPYAAPAPAYHQAVGARTRPEGVTFLAILVALQAADGILSILSNLGTADIAVLIFLGILTIATMILVWGLWTVRRWAFVTAIVLEIVYLLFACNLTSPADLVTIIVRVNMEVVIPLTVLICLFTVRDVRASFRVNPPRQGQQHTFLGASPQWQQHEPLHPQYPPQMPPPQPQWQQLLPPPQPWQRPPMPVQPALREQQLPPPSGQPFSSQPPYDVSPFPNVGQSRQSKKRLRPRLWISLAVLGGIVVFSGVSSIIAGLFFGGAGTGTVWGVSVFLLIEVGIGLIIWLHIGNQYILQYGDLVVGRITKHHKERDEQTALGFLTDFGSLIYTYYLTYTYEYRGKTYSAKQKVRKKTYREIPDGTWIRVRCLPKHPKRARIAEQWSHRFIIIP